MNKTQSSAKITWNKKNNEQFNDNKFSREHTWEFDGGAKIPASSSPSVVPLPYSNESNIDPEEAFVASLSSCHMLVFLSICAQKGYVVEQYIDNAIGFTEENTSGRISVTKVILQAKVIFKNIKLSLLEIEEIHKESHDICFIANSVKTEVVTKIVL